MAVLVKTLNGLAYGSVKTRNGLAVASIKSINGVDTTVAPVTFAYRTAAVDATDSTTYTFTGQSIGPEADRSHVIVGILARRVGTTDITSVTIGGVTATRIFQYQSSDGVAAFYGAAVPTGTTATVVVTLDASVARCGIAVWSAKNLSSLVPFDDTSAGGSGQVSINLSTTAPSGDSFILAVAYSSFGSPQEVTWSGLTENADLAFEALGDFSAASSAFTTSGSKSISASWPNSSLNFGAAVSLQ